MPEATSYDIPAKCKAGVVVDAGPNFRVEIVDVDVPKYISPTEHSSSYYRANTMLPGPGLTIF